jgi:hypothetical protein
MRLVQARKEESVYVTLSDLLTMVMAIFVLLFLVMMAQVKPPAPVIPDLRDKVAELERAVAQSQQQLAAAVRKDPIELVIAIDTSGSMEVPLSNLRKAIKRLATEIPKFTDLRVGIVAYGGSDRERLNRPWREFPLQSVALADPPANTRDFHRLDPRLRQFLDVEIKDLSGGNVDVVAAVGKALNFFAQHGRPGARKVFALIGDVGPYESLGGNIYFNDNRGTTTARVDRRYEQGLYDQIRQFVGAHPSARVLSMYTGYATRPGHDSYQIIHATQPYSPDFFQTMSATAGERGTYSEDPGDMLSMLLLSMITTGK